MPRLVIHVGSQKTGSTSVQTFLTQNPRMLEKAGLSYVKAGRGPAAHNRLAFKRDTDSFPNIMQRVVAEIENIPDKTHIISAEMLFTVRMARSLIKFLPSELRQDTKIVAYVRRQDKFLEAMFKQVVKTGRFTGTPQEYAEKRANALKYSKILDAYAEGFGVENIFVLPYEPKTFLQNNVILDISPHLGLHSVQSEDLPKAFSNVTLSREVSDLLGLIARTTDVNIAELIRVIIADNPDGAFYKGDGYSMQERKEIVDRYRDDNNYVRSKFRSDLDELFDIADLSGDLPDALVPLNEQIRRMRLAQSAVFGALGKSHQTELRQ